MRKLMLIAIAIASLVIAGAAIAKTVAVTITKNGYVPNAVTVAAGDTVQFTNSDTVAHQIVFKPTTGVTCVPNPLVLQPTQSGTCTFQTAGKFAYSDPNVKGNTFRGTVTVGSAPNPPAPDTLTLAAKPPLVIYGGKVTLSGTLSNQKVGENVDVLAKPCGQTAQTKVTTVQTTTGGAFTAVVRPLKNTLYTVKVKSTTSNAVSEKVRPKLRLRKLAAHRYSLRVFASQSFAGRYGTFQRYNGTLGRWVTVKRVLLRANSTGVAPTVISSVSFRSTIRPLLKVRVILPQLQVGSCYRPGRSNVIRS
ncbi:MAG: cupredoxin domain-containing protein [Actinomycetota bacterium]|nr:cupredoxin domain-containing protein [Actinomycetota bacterium]